MAWAWAKITSLVETLLSWPLTTSLALTTGTGTPTHARNTVATFLDHESVYWSILSGEVRFTGSRRVENLLSYSEGFTNEMWVKAAGASFSGSLLTTDGSVGARMTHQYISNGDKIVFSVELSEGTLPDASIRLYNSTKTSDIVATTALSLTADRKRYSITSPSVIPKGDTIVCYINPGVWTETTPGNINVHTSQLENVTNQTNQNPGEYVSTDALSDPWHNAGVDGVKYFDTENGNTVASNIVTEATGAALTSLKGINLEPGSTNLALHNQSHDDVVWAKTNITVTPDDTTSIISGNDADLLTATAGNATILQSITSASADRSYQVALKRKTGTGDIDITVDNGATWATKVITSSWAMYDIQQAAVTNPIIGIRIVTSGDEIWADIDQLENSAFPTTPIITAAASVTRNKEELSLQVSGNLPSSGVRHIKFDVTPKGIDSGTAQCLCTTRSDATNYVAIWLDGVDIWIEKMVAGVSEVASLAVAAVVDTTYQIDAFINADNTLNLEVDGTPDDTNTSTTLAPVYGTNIEYGSLAGVSNAYCNFANHTITNSLTVV